MAVEPKEMNFETAMKKLESIVENLENGELSLEDALKAYEEGVRLADACGKKLTEAEKKIEVLMKTDFGRFKTAALEEAGKDEGEKKKKR